MKGKELFRVEIVSKTAEIVVEYCHALMYDAIHEQIVELFTD